jgi:hypothetical protein
LRQARCAAAFVDPETINKALIKEDWGEDHLGAAIAKAADRGRGNNADALRGRGRGRGSGRGTSQCWYCGISGHKAGECRKRIAAGEPVPSAPKMPASAPATVPTRQQGGAGAGGK